MKNRESSVMENNSPIQEQGFVLFAFKMYYRPLPPGICNLTGSLLTHDDALY